MSRYSEPQIAAAVAWWRAALVRPKYDALGSERDSAMEMAQLLMATSTSRLSDAQLDTFAAHLTDVLAGRCEHTWKAHNGEEYPVTRDRFLRVDYGPDLVLGHCGEIAGFPPAFFWPIKTTVWLDDDGSVKVRHGYGAETVTVHPADPADTSDAPESASSRTGGQQT